MNKNLIIGILIIVIALLGYFLYQKPKKEIIKVPVTITIPIPGKTNTFPPVDLPKPKKEKPRPILDIPEEDKDSVLSDALTERDYEEIFTDSTQSITVKSKVQGRLLKQEVGYEIFPSTITVDTIIDVEIPKKEKPHLFLGADTDIGPNGEIIFRPEVDLQLKKHLFSVGKGTNNYWTIGYKLKLF